MRKVVVATVFVFFGYFAAEAWGVTTLETTRGAVTEQCGLNQGGSEKSGCVRPCGSTDCHYHCDDAGKCSVTIYRVVAKKPLQPKPAATAPTNP
jgi:hypothetical protein